MTQAQLDLQKQLEQTLFDDSLVLFLESIDQEKAHPSQQIEQTKHTTSSNVHTLLDNTHEIPPPPKNATKI